MANFIDEFMKSYGSEVTQHMSSNLGLDQGTVQQLIPKLAPLILGGLKRQKDDQGGEERVDHILNKYGDSSVLGNLKDLIASKISSESVDPNLGGLLGNGGGVQAAQALGKSMNIDPSKIMKMIPALAPIVLGALSHKRDSGGAGISGIGSLLDADGDGSIIDDVAGFIFKGSGAQGKGTGILGSLLGGLFGKRQ